MHPMVPLVASWAPVLDNHELFSASTTLLTLECHVSGTMHATAVGFWLLSLSTATVRSFHVILSIGGLFFYSAE